MGLEIIHIPPVPLVQHQLHHRRYGLICRRVVCLQMLVEHPDGAKLVGHRCCVVDQAMPAFPLVQEARRRVYARLYKQRAVQAEGNISRHIGATVHICISVEGCFEARHEVDDRTGCQLWYLKELWRMNYLLTDSK